MTDCVFCQIIARRIPTTILYEDTDVVAFRDAHPVAPTHILVVPRRHIPDLSAIREADTPVISRMIIVATGLAKQEGVSQKGFRLVINSGAEGGQLVPHLHMHLIGGRKLGSRLS